MTEAFQVFFDSRSDIKIGFDGIGWEVETHLLNDPDSSADICGPHIGFVMPLTGWTFAAAPLRTVAWDQDGRIVAICWASQTKRQGADECNLTYIVDPAYRGQGLGTLVASAATVYQAQLCALAQIDLCRINVQSRDTNVGSVHVARSLGLSPDADRDFQVNLPEDRTLQYVGFSAPFNAIVESALARLNERTQGSQRPRARAQR